MAKTSPDAEQKWLPLWMHLNDTAGVMKKLILKWIPDAVVDALGIDFEHFMQLAVFLAAVHDIGKATSYFQSIITKVCPEKYEELCANGYTINKEYRASGKTPHAYAGQWILQSDTNDFKLAECIAMLVGAHHGNPSNSVAYMGEPDLIKLYPVNFFGTECEDSNKQLWIKSWMDIVNQAKNTAGIKDLGELTKVNIRAQVLISGLLIIADWIASNTTYFPLIQLDDYGSRTMYPQRVNDGWHKLSFPSTWCSEVNYMDSGIFKERFGFLPNDVQRSMFEVVNSSKCPGLFILEAQMGVGKTEAALAAAEILAARKKEGGIFWGLPTQATSNGMFSRMYEWGKNVSDDTLNAICLSHGSAQFNEQYNQLLMESKAYIENAENDRGGIEVHPWFQGNKKNLLADFVIGTVDQFLMASLKRRHFMLRHIGLVGKVVVIDECHAYDAYMTEYLKRSLQWMAAYGVPVILLSATLPAKRRKELVECYAKSYSKYHLGKQKAEIIEQREDWRSHTAYPLITWTDAECIKQRDIICDAASKKVKIDRIDSVKVMVEFLKEKLSYGGCACIIANTIKKAQDIYEECNRQLDGFKIILYHAQYIMADREKKEKIILEKMGKFSGEKDRDKLILIGTQVLEQSLDYDADIMVTQLCPIDLFFQRIGRLHRHKRNRTETLKYPQCILLEEKDDPYDAGTKAVYGDYLLMRTERILKNSVAIPEDITELVQKVYDEENALGLTGEEYDKAVLQYKKEIERKRQIADNYRITVPGMKRYIDELLSNPERSNEKISEACVRDAETSIEVLLMKKCKDSRIKFIDDLQENEESLSSYDVPNSVQGRRIAQQRLRLPHIFSAVWNIDATIQELEDLNRMGLPQWQQCPWIQGDLILLLNEENQASLNGYRLTYSYDKGLEYIKEEGRNAGEGV